MTPEPEIFGAIVAKAIGAMAGSVIALVFMLPTGRRDFLQRAAVSLVSGMIFAAVARHKLGFTEDLDGLIAGAGVASAMSWWVMGAAIRILGIWNPFKKTG